MCPVCIVTLALVAAGATSVGGLTTLVVNKLHAKTGANSIGLATQTGGEQNETRS